MDFLISPFFMYKELKYTFKYLYLIADTLTWGIEWMLMPLLSLLGYDTSSPESAEPRFSLHPEPLILKAQTVSAQPHHYDRTFKKITVLTNSIYEQRINNQLYSYRGSDCRLERQEAGGVGTRTKRRPVFSRRHISR